MCVCAVADDTEQGVMDNLLEALKTGDAFAVNRERKEGKKRTPRVAGGTVVLSKPFLLALLCNRIAVTEIIRKLVLYYAVFYSVF